MARIFVFRHAQTTDNAGRIFSGKRDPDLTFDGILEAEKMRYELKNEDITLAFSSNQTRARKTLEIVLGEHEGVEPAYDDRLDERDYGDLTGKNKDDVAREQPEKYLLWHRSYDSTPPNGESLEDVEKRVLGFLNEILPALNKNDVVLISANGNSLRPIRRFFENLSIEEMCSFEHTPGKIYSYEADSPGLNNWRML